MSVKYTEYKQLNMPSIEQDFLQRWKQGKYFEQSVSQRDGAQPFVFYEGPPSANGMPGIHHVIARTLKDLVCRYKTMQGFQVKRKAGWDTHGLPVELGVEKELGITKEDIGKTISVEEYNQKCREAVMRYKDKWSEITEKMGYWVDLSDPYITFDNKYIETLWWALKQLFEKDLLYKSVSIQPYSPAAGTGLSNAELNMPGTYKDVKDTTVVAMFKAVRDTNSEFLFQAAGSDDVFFMAWTTTPWTLPSNCGLTVGPEIDYVLVKTFNPYTHQPQNVVLAKALLGKWFKAEGQDGDFAGYTAENKVIPWHIQAEFKGKQVDQCRYEQLLPTPGNTAEIAGGDPFRVITGDFVTTEDGTGIVHTAPAFGADDYKVGKKNNIGILVMVDKQGKFIESMGEWADRYVKNYKDDPDYKDVDVDISVKLKLEGRAFKVEKYEHTYPHCWRTDKPVLYYPLDAWFIRTTAVKDRMIELNKTINWKPKATGEGRFGNWLENMVDWNLSRSRYWGTPLPVWVSEDGAEKKCIGSVKELVEEMKKADKILNLNQVADFTGSENPSDEDLQALLDGKTPEPTAQNDLRLETPKRNFDLHKPYVDAIVLVDSRGNAMSRESDLVDVWFDSGAMPYAQWHYPFENKEKLKHSFPADFIAEGVDQTRGWFYTLHALGVLLFDSVAYKTVVSNGLVLDKNGNKMAKSKGNTIDPFATIDQYSADATRWYLVTNASPWDSLRFDVEGIKEVQRKHFGTLYNTYQFFALYANVDGFAFREKYIPINERPEIDRWILSSLHSLIKDVSRFMNDYEPTQAGRAIEYFLDEQLSNWYVRLCRRRFWKGEYEHDKISAYQTLYECLETLSLLMAPIAPFFSDWLFTNLNQVTGRNKAVSVHLADFPTAEEQAIDAGLEERMHLAQDITSLVLSIRKKVNLKVRQPLQKVLIPVLDAHMHEQIQAVEALVKNEVNVKLFEYLTETEGFIKKKVKPNFKSLGARMGAKMKAVAAEIGKMNQQDIANLERNKYFDILIDNEPVRISTEDVDIIAEDIPGWSVANKDNLTVALDVTVTPELQDEGNARELVNRIQKIRKETGLDLTDRIVVKIQEYEPLKSAIINFSDYICAEILADNIEIIPQLTSGTEIEVNEATLKVLISKNT
ncbi:isoleucine--tRNA ligase [Taibaiella soli]|uniref:Isoleucine--tRNA ligase n=1 Tax=Taibaiella soli TaxID=1649169 RepID=A0A2W2AUQ0_9BACT|nr:isoleucine--tRNA ligase [Taibaiella soli]PZF71694.1 isoleucine--tRNA ligase [Taibaiella soli]